MKINVSEGTKNIQRTNYFNYQRKSAFLSKEFNDFVEEAKELDTAEVVSLVSQAVMVEVPRIVEAIKA